MTACIGKGKIPPPQVAAVRKAEPAFVCRPSPRREMAKMRGNIGPSKKNTRREAAAMALVFIASTAGMLTMIIEKIKVPRNDIRRSSRGAIISVSPAKKKRLNVKSD